MFLCKKCLENNYLVETPRGLEPWTEKSWLGLPASFGPCEDCHRSQPCYDIHHSKIAHKDSQYAKENYHPKVTIEGIDRVIRGRKDISYTRDEIGLVSVTHGKNELLTFFPVMGGKRGYRIIYSNFNNPNEIEDSEGTFDTEVKASNFFFKQLARMAGI